MFRFHVVHAIFWRNFKQYFTSILGYLFIFVFVLSCAILTFNQQFFADNLANLDKLSQYFPALLLFFIPAITMTSWADEKKQGTDTILFTLPASDFEIIFGKFKAIVGVYTIALLFSGTVLVALARLGTPDWGVVATTYIGFWFAGVALIAIGMFASSLTSSTTVAFVLAAILCAIPVLLGYVVEGNRTLENYGVPGQLRDFAAGMISLPGVVYFVAITAFMLYLNYVVISRRHWSRGKQVTLSGHFALRILALAAALVSINVLADRSSAMFNNRVDLTAERLFTLDETTRTTLAEAEDNGRSIEIQAFLSPEAQIPPRYVNTRKNLVNLLRQYDRLGGSNVSVRFVDVLPNSDAVREAISLKMEKRSAREVVNGRITEQDVFMGVRVTSSFDEVTIPFVDGDTSLEYELTRSIASATAEQKKLKLGILSTDAHFANVYFQGKVYPWSAAQTIKKLEQQYELIRVSADQLPTMLVDLEIEKKSKQQASAQAADNNDAEQDGGKKDGDEKAKDEKKKSSSNIPDVLIVADPSSLTAAGLKSLSDYIQAGQPTLIMADPLPFYRAVYEAPTNLGIINAPAQARIKDDAGWAPLNTSTSPKGFNGRATTLLEQLGVEWRHDQVVWSMNNPHVGFKPEIFEGITYMTGDRWPEEYGPLQNLFVFAKSHADHAAFNPGNPISSGLHELMFAYPGSIRPKTVADGETASTNFQPLVTLKAGSAGHFDWDEFTEDYVSTRLELNPYTQESKTVTGTQVSRFTGHNIRTLRKRPKLKRPASGDDDNSADDDGKSEARTALDSGVHVLAARITGNGENKTNVVFIADTDFISDFYFKQKDAVGSPLDNYTFFVNAVESLAGDESFVRLRNRRPIPRTLSSIETMKEPYKLEAVNERDNAEQEFNAQLDKARKRAEKKEKSLAEDEEMSAAERTQRLMFSQMNEESKLGRQNERIQKELDKRLSLIKGKEEASSRRVETRVRWLSILSAGLPALFLGSLVLCYRTLREQRNIDPARRVKKN